MQNDFFTIVDPSDSENPNKETRLEFSYEDIGGHDGVPAEPVTLQFSSRHYKQTIMGPKVQIGRQQLAELGALFLALAGTVDVDFSGADALLDGFYLKGKAAATALAKALEE